MLFLDKITAYWKKKLKTSRRQLELDLLATPEKRRYFSPIYYGQYEVTLPLLSKHIKGRLLDLGCGDLPFRDELAKLVSQYDTLDFFPRTNQLTYIADIQDMSIVSSNLYDSAICLEVLEHIPDPFQAVREIYRVLAPQGILILSVPHLSRLHEEPHDYYRYTHYGLHYLLEQAGFKIVTVRRRGGLMTFLGHQISTILLGTVWSIPIIQELAWFINSWLITRLFFKIDQSLSESDIFAAGFTVVATKD